jgi:hypothetical protein
MGRINLGRVVLGGLVAGVIICAFEFVLNGLALKDQWIDLMHAIGREPLGMTEVLYFNIFAFIQGFAAVWTYAAIRPRFGEGPMTAIVASLLTWVTAYVLVDGMPTIMGVFPLSMTLTLLGVGLIEIVVATLAGAWLYKEN